MNIKELIDSGMKYLEYNDLDGFYDYIKSNVSHDADVRTVTEILEDCGIDTVNNFKNGIPYGYLCLDDYIPDSLIKGDGIAFPKNIKTIGESAFYCNNHSNLSTVDLTNIEKIGPYAFQESSVETIYLPDPNEIELDLTVFYLTNLSKIYFPSSVRNDYNDSDILDWILCNIEDSEDVVDMNIGYW